MAFWYSVSVLQCVTYIQQWRVSDVPLIDMCKEVERTYMSFSLKIKMAFCKG